MTLGGVTLTARITPGHTPGCTTWTMNDVVFLCSPTAPGYKLVGNPRYPNAIEDYRRQFAILHSLEPQIFLGSHGVFFRLDEKRKKHGATNAFIDPDGYRDFVAAMEKSFEEKVAAQRKQSAGKSQ